MEISWEQSSQRPAPCSIPPTKLGESNIIFGEGLLLRIRHQYQIACALGGEPGARLLPPLGMAARPDTRLRLIRQTPVRPPQYPSVLGVDDFACRCGSTDGTIVVDLDAHQPVDRLPDRTAPRLAHWLATQLAGPMIARDRRGIDAAGATQGHPRRRRSPIAGTSLRTAVTRWNAGAGGMAQRSAEPWLRLR